MDMLDEIHHHHHHHNHHRKPGRSPAEEIARLPEEESGCYERLVHYSATLERAKRGQTYLDGYLWDELEQRFRRPESSSTALPSETSNHFLEDSLPPFEIDREKLRQWDLLSTAAPVKEGGRRPLGPAPNSEPHLPPADHHPADNHPADNHPAEAEAEAEMAGPTSHAHRPADPSKSPPGRSEPASTAPPSGSKAYGQLKRAHGDVRIARQVQTRPPGGHC